MTISQDMVHISHENAHRYSVFSLLQQGVLVALPEKSSVSALACRILNIDLPAFRREVQTVLLNHGVVDNPDSTILDNGDLLVLSGAMPGLVGAMLRSDSPIKALRERITDAGVQKDRFLPESMIVIKFFNTILKNHRDDILKYGFYVQRSDHE